MFSCPMSNLEVTDLGNIEQRSSPQGPDIKAMEKNLQRVVKMAFLTFVKEDDAEGLEEALLAERKSDVKPSNKKSKKKNNAKGAKEDDAFSVLGRSLLHYACALDSIECCTLLLTPQNLPRVRADAVEEFDGRSALHFACLHYSRRCVEVLLKHGANVSLKNKQAMLPLEEVFASPKIYIEWDLSMPASEIVEEVGKKDLTILRLLEPKCKDQLTPVAFKLVKCLRIVPLVALLHVARNSVVNSVAKNVELEESSNSTLVDYLLGKALAFLPFSPLEKSSDKLSKCRKMKVEGCGESWSGEASSMYRKTLNEGEGFVPELKHRKTTSDWQSGISNSKLQRDLGEYEETAMEIKCKRELSEWEEINMKYRSKSGAGENGFTESNNRLTVSNFEEGKEKAWYKGLDEKSLIINEEPEKTSRIARKLLECVLLFKPRLSSHSQSSFPPPLLRAAQANDEELVDLLLDAGALVNETDIDGNTALHWALRQATPLNKRGVSGKVVQKLLEAGANVVVGNKLGATPVHTAAGHGHFEALSLILQKDSASVNVMAATKETPLHYSVKNNHMHCTALLIKHGANRNVTSLRNQKPYQLATSSEMKLLLSIDEKLLHERSMDDLMALCTSQQHLSFSHQNPVSSNYSVVETLSVYPLHAGFDVSAHANTFPHPLSEANPGYHVYAPLRESLTQSQTFCSSSTSCLSQSPLSFSESVKKPTSQCQIQSLTLLPSLPILNSSAAFDSSCQVQYKSSSHPYLAMGPQVSAGDDLLNKANVNLPAFKTVPCRFFGSTSGCGWGSKCHFAHSEEELRLGQQHLKISTLKNEGVVSSQGGQILIDGSFKTKLCMHYEKMKTCPHNGKCKFAHGEAELRPSLVPSCIGSNMRSGARPSTASSLGSCCSEEEETSSKKIFVGGLPLYITSEDLSEFFEGEFGKVVDAVVICGNDEEGNTRSRGFGFVLFESQRDADEAVKRHFFPLRGKKVEVKKAMSRFESLSGDERGKLATSSEISSPAGSLSPALFSAGSNVGLVNEGLLLSASPSSVHHQAWSLPSLSVEPILLPEEGVQDLQKPVELILPLGQTLFHPHMGSSQSSDCIERSEIRKTLSPLENGEMIGSNGHSESEKSLCDIHNEAFTDIDCLGRKNSNYSYSLYSSCPLEDSHGMPNSKIALHLNHSPPAKSQLHQPLTSLGNGSSSLNSNSALQRKVDVEQSDDEDEQLSELLALLKVGNNLSSNSSSTFGSLNNQLKGASRNITQDRLVDRGSQSATSITQRESCFPSSKDSHYAPLHCSSYNTALQSGSFDSLSLNGFENVLHPVDPRKAGDAPITSGYTGLPGNVLYNEFSPIPWGHKDIHEIQASGVQNDIIKKISAPSVSNADSMSNTHSSNVCSTSLPVYKTLKPPGYNVGYFSRFGISG